MAEWEAIKGNHLIELSQGQVIVEKIALLKSAWQWQRGDATVPHFSSNTVNIIIILPVNTHRNSMNYAILKYICYCSSLFICYFIFAVAWLNPVGFYDSSDVFKVLLTSPFTKLWAQFYLVAMVDLWPCRHGWPLTFDLWPWHTVYVTRIIIYDYKTFISPHFWLTDQLPSVGLIQTHPKY